MRNISRGRGRGGRGRGLVKRNASSSRSSTPAKKIKSGKSLVAAKPTSSALVRSGSDAADSTFVVIYSGRTYTSPTDLLEHAKTMVDLDARSAFLHRGQEAMEEKREKDGELSPGLYAALPAFIC